MNVYALEEFCFPQTRWDYKSYVLLSFTEQSVVTWDKLVGIKWRHLEW